MVVSLLHLNAVTLLKAFTNILCCKSWYHEAYERFHCNFLLYKLLHNFLIMLLCWHSLGGHGETNVSYGNLCRREDDKFLQESRQILGKNLNRTDLTSLLKKIIICGQHKLPCNLFAFTILSSEHSLVKLVVIFWIYDLKHCTCNFYQVTRSYGHLKTTIRRIVINIDRGSVHHVHVRESSMWTLSR